MYRIAVDVGGTFTDCAVLDERGNTIIGKAPSTPPDFEHGVMDSLAVASARVGVSREEMLRDCSHFIHGSTVATNIMIQRTGCKVGLITTKGHENTIIIGKSTSKVDGLSALEQTYAARLHKPEPQIVPRDLICGVDERVDYSGEVIVPLDTSNAEKAVAYLVDKGVEGIAICLLWSFQNPEHEHRLTGIIQSKYPHIMCTASVDIMPVLGEYERTVATVIDVYIKKGVKRYLENLTAEMRKAGHTRPVLIMSSSGGITSLEDACSRSLQTIDSGPVGGVVGSRFYARATGESSIIATDVGGTSFDVSLVDKGELQLETEPVINQYKLFFPRVMTNSVGAGGGSIARIERGILRVGPQSAGTVPGPVCYDSGGVEPTVTDADLVLGYLNPDYFLGGSIKLNKEKAEAAIKKLADQLRLTVLETAAGIYKVASSHMADLVRICTIQRGFDPRDFVLMCYGGAGPLHAPAYSADAGVRKLIIPYNASVFSAVGMLTCEMLHIFEYSAPMRSPFVAENLGKMNSIFSDLEKRLYDQFKEEGIKRQDVRVKRYGRMRFLIQYHQVDVSLPNRDFTAEDEGLLEKLFYEAYEARYGQGATLEGAACEIISYRVQGFHMPFIPQVKKQQDKASPDPSQACKGERPAYSAKNGAMMPTKIYEGDKLCYGHILKGPCIIERWGDTVVIPDGQRAFIDEYQNIVIQTDN